MNLRHTVFSTTLIAIALSCTNAHAVDFSTEVQFERHHKDWMSAVPDARRLSDMSLPGTHDSGATSSAGYLGNIPLVNAIVNDVVRTQTASIPEQLAGGIRVLDIRCNHQNNTFQLQHGIVDLKLSFSQVIAQVKEFLAAHPSETVLMRVKEEEAGKNNTRTFAETFADYQNKDGKELFWAPVNDNPTLAETRGKVVILQDFPGPAVGLWYGSFVSQDWWRLNSPWDLHQKWEKVKTHLTQANSNIPKSNNFYINYLSGSTGAQPFFVAGGKLYANTNAPNAITGLTTPGFNGWYPDFPRGSCFWFVCSIYFQGTNILVREFIAANNPAAVGIIMADFPGTDLIEGVISRNHTQRCKEWGSEQRKANLGDVFRYANPYTKSIDFFAPKHNGVYWYFPTDQKDNPDWKYLGHTPYCKA